jgi:AAHS family 4-hydroxybenzoate transporter-like MFS transporter
MAATSLQQFVVLRFLTGIGLGGVIPNVIALTAEMAPKRLRGMFIAIVNFGVTAGLALPGIVAAILVPRYGWQVLLLVGGLLPLVIALLALVLFPESIKYLAQRGDRDDAVRRLARVLRPDVSIGPATRFSMATHAAGASGSPKQLFAGTLAVVTPVLWIALAANQMVNFFVLSWLPTLLQSAGSSTAEAGVASAMFAIGGLAGGLFVTLIVDRLGVIPLVVLFTFGVPAVAAIGITNLEPGIFRAIVASAGFCITGINFGMNVALGTIYPTQVRSMGTGWAQGFGRIGSLAAPILGGALLGMHLSMQELLFVPALTLAVGAVACVMLAVLCIRQFGGYRLDEF